MKQILLASIFLCIISLSKVFAQTHTVTGTVIAKDDGLPIPGASVKIIGTSIGALTNGTGKFTLNVSPGQSLNISFLGYTPQIIKINNEVTLNIIMVSANTQLGEVVVTGALGIRHQAKQQGYAATNIDNKTLTESHPPNIANGLTAKVAGLVVTTYNNGIDPSVGFTLRGNRHIEGNNFALVILNGVPISPNDLNDINPDDVASVNVLNGSGAAALYGSEASNGALIITTKHGTTSGAPIINYSNTFQLEQVSYFPSLQRQFGSGSSETSLPVAPFTVYIDPVTNFNINPVPFENQSYGPEFDGHLQQLGIPLADGTIQKYPYASTGKDPRLAFFNTGYSEQNNVSYSSGDEKNNVFFSANNLAASGVVPLDRHDRTTVRGTAVKTYGILKLEFNGGYTQSHTSTYGRDFYYPGLNGGAPLFFDLLYTPAWVPLQKFKNQDAPFSDPSTYFNAYGINPYWTVQKSRINTRNDLFNGSFSGVLTPTSWLDATYRLTDNFGVSKYQYTREEIDFTAYALSNPYGYGTMASGLAPIIPGQLQNITQFGDGSLATGAGPQGYSRLQQDIFVNFHKTFFKNFKTNLLLGNSIWQEYYQQISNSSTNLLLKDFYNIDSILGTPTTAQSEGKIRQIGYFASLNIGYHDFAFLELTGRNDHDSRLSATNRSFFYPSAKGSFIFTDAIPALRQSFLSYGKLRASISQVGEVNTNPYTIYPTYNPVPGFPYGNIGGLGISTTFNNPVLKPEITDELEFGADLGLFNNRINLNITYFDTHTKNQTLPITSSPSTGYNQTYLNIGEVQNTGWEFAANLQVLTKDRNKVGLTLGGNLAIADSKVLSLANGLPQLLLGGNNLNVGSFAIVGKPFPYLMATDLNRDPHGNPIVDAKTGLPSLNDNYQPIGSLSPKYTLGLTQSVSYKFVSLTLTSEFRTGNVIYNGGQRIGTTSGTSELSARAGRQRFIFPNSVIETSPGVYVKNTDVSTNDGNLNFWNSSAYVNAGTTDVADGAFWKLREANLSFDLTPLAKKTSFLKKASFSLIGRNLLMFRPKSNNWADPEFSFASGTVEGINSTDQMPPTRFYGANLNLTF